MRDYAPWHIEFGSWATGICALTDRAASEANELRARLEAAGFATALTGEPSRVVMVSSPTVPAQAPAPPWIAGEARRLWDRFCWLLRHAHEANARREQAGKSSPRRRGVFTFSWPPEHGQSDPSPSSPHFHGLVLREDSSSGHLLLLGLLLYLSTSFHVGHGGLALHSSAVARGDEGFLFLGDSEAGKSTAARLSSSVGRPSLGDDMNLVVRAHGRFSLAALPSPNMPPQGYAQTRPRLRAVFRLVQDTEDAVVPLSVNDATKVLFEGFSQVPAGRSLPAPARALAFHTVCDIARSVPAFSLHFRATPEFWGVIDRCLPVSPPQPIVPLPRTHNASARTSRTRR